MIVPMRDWLISENEKLILKVYIQPGSSRDEIVGEYGNPLRLKIKIASPPVDGKANKHLISFLSKILKISKNQINLKRGDTSRSKDLLLDAKYDEILIKLESLLKNKLDNKNQQ